MEKSQHEPGEPTLEDLADRFGENLARLQGVREMFLTKQDMSSELTMSQMEDLYDSFESTQIEKILARIEQQHKIPWKASAESIPDNTPDTDPSADTFIDTFGRKIIRYEALAAEGDEQIELVMNYSINTFGRIERAITTEVEKIENPLDSAEHPALITLNLPNGEKINVSSTNNEADRTELDIVQAKAFVDLLQEIVGELAKIYHQPGWLVLPDTERVGKYKIERIDSD